MGARPDFWIEGGPGPSWFFSLGHRQMGEPGGQGRGGGSCVSQEEFAHQVAKSSSVKFTPTLNLSWKSVL